MKQIIKAAQGTPEWHQHRRAHFNASDAAAMLGISPYKTRSHLLHEKATGLTPEIDSHTQKIFDRGHAFEAQARPWAEEVITEELYPVVLADEIDGLPLSASLDGLTIDDSQSWEHKTLSNGIRAAATDNDIPDHIKPQIEQGLLISGAERCLFMASAGDENDRVEIWIESDPTLRQKLIEGWAQFAKDLDAYVPPEPEKVVEGTAPELLPALRIEVTGSVIASNLDQFKARAMAVFDGIRTDLQTDDDFASAEATVKWCKGLEDRLKGGKEHALSQTEDIYTLLNTVDEIIESARQKRLSLEKLVKAEKEARKLDIIESGLAAMREHIAAINKTLSKVNMPNIVVDFVGAAKNKRTLSSLRDAVDTELARAKIEADRVANKIRANIDVLRAESEGYAGLFPDANELVKSKSEEDLINLARLRITEHKQAQAKRQEAAKASEDAEKARQAEADRQELEAATNKPEQKPVRSSPVTAPVARPERSRPTNNAIIEIIAEYYNEHEARVIEWLAETDWTEYQQRDKRATTIANKQATA